MLCPCVVDKLGKGGQRIDVCEVQLLESALRPVNTRTRNSIYQCFVRTKFWFMDYYLVLILVTCKFIYYAIKFWRWRPCLWNQFCHIPTTVTPQPPASSSMPDSVWIPISVFSSLWRFPSVCQCRPYVAFHGICLPNWLGYLIPTILFDSSYEKVINETASDPLLVTKQIALKYRGSRRGKLGPWATCAWRSLPRHGLRADALPLLVILMTVAVYIYKCWDRFKSFTDADTLLMLVYYITNAYWYTLAGNIKINKYKWIKSATKQIFCTKRGDARGQVFGN